MWFTKKMSGCLMALQIPCNLEYNRFPPSLGVSEVPKCLFCNHWETRGKMTVCHIRCWTSGGFFVTTFHASASLSNSVLYRVAAFIALVCRTLALATFYESCKLMSNWWHCMIDMYWLIFFPSLQPSNAQKLFPFFSFYKIFILHIKSGKICSLRQVLICLLPCLFCDSVFA